MTNAGPHARRASTEALYEALARVPWWMMIILILSVLALYSVFTSTEYVPVLQFVLGLPWDTELVGRVTAESDGTWTFTPPKGLRPGKYRLYAEFLDEDANVLGQSDLYHIEIPKGAEPVEMAPITEPPATRLEVQTSTPTIAGTTTPEATVHIYDDLIFSKIPRKIWNSNGVLLTIKVTLIAYSIALIIGLIAGLGRVSGRSPDLIAGLLLRSLVGLGLAALLGVLWHYWRDFKLLVAVVLGIEIVMFLLPALPYTISTFYVEVVRGLPLLVIILYVGFVITPFLRDGTRDLFAKLPTMITGAGYLPTWVSSSLLKLLDQLPESIDLGGVPGAMIGLAFGYGAYLAEVYRSGIESIHRGQMEAARSLGMSYFQAMRYVILPQAIRRILPPLGNDFIAMLKDSSLIAVVALPELLQMGRLYVSRTFRAFPGYNTVALNYLLMTFVLSLIVSVIERKMSIEE